MSDDENRDIDELMDRISISPEPDDSELVAILQALEFLGQSDEVPDRSTPPESEWARIGRTGSLRARNWPAQVRGWSAGRS